MAHSQTYICPDVDHSASIAVMLKSHDSILFLHFFDFFCQTRTPVSNTKYHLPQ